MDLPVTKYKLKQVRSILNELKATSTCEGPSEELMMPVILVDEGPAPVGNLGSAFLAATMTLLMFATVRRIIRETFKKLERRINLLIDKMVSRPPSQCIHKFT